MARSATDEKVDRSIIENRAPSVGHMFRERVQALPEGEAFRYPVGDGWESLTWSQTRDRAYALAAGLVDLGVQPEERVALMSSTRIEWVLSDLAVMCAGAATTTIYPTTITEDVAYIVADSGSRVVIAEDEEQVAKLRERAGELGELLKVVVVDGQGDGEHVITFAELEELGRARLEREPDVVDARIDGLTPEHLATIIYTSGTTGRPKGVRLPHSAWTYEAAAVASIGILSQCRSWLLKPLASSSGSCLV